MKKLLENEKVKIHLALFFLLSVIITHNGIWFMPNIYGQFLISQNLTQNPFHNPLAQYIYTNYFAPFMFGILGGKSIYEYIIYMFFISVMFIYVFFYWLIKYYKIKLFKEIYKLFVILIFPVFYIPFYWIGMDGMTLLLMLLIMITFDTKISVIFSLFLGVQHFSQGFLAFVLLFIGICLKYIFYVKSENKRFKQEFIQVIYILGGIVVGKLLLEVYFYIFHIHLVGGRVLYLKKYFNTFLSQWENSWFFILYSFFGIGWLLILKFFKKMKILLFITIIVMILMLVIGDQTRVGVIVLFPVLFYFVFLEQDIINNITCEYAFGLMVLYLIIPPVYVWGGFPFTSLFQYDLCVLKKISHKEYKSIKFVEPFKLQKTIVGKKDEHCFF